MIIIIAVKDVVLCKRKHAERGGGGHNHPVRVGKGDLVDGAAAGIASKDTDALPGAVVPDADLAVRGGSDGPPSLHLAHCHRLHVAKRMQGLCHTRMSGPEVAGAIFACRHGKVRLHVCRGDALRMRSQTKLLAEGERVLWCIALGAVPSVCHRGQEGMQAAAG